MEELIKFASAALGLTESEVSALVKDGDKLKADATTVLLDKHKEKVAKDAEQVKIKSDEKADNYFKKAQKETHELYMNGLSRLGIDKTLPADKALEALDAKIKTLTEAGGDEAKILKSEVFIRKEKEIRDEMNGIREKEVGELKKQIDTIQNETAQREITSKLRQKFEDEVGLLTLVDGLTPEQVKFMKDSAFQTFLQANKFKNVDGVLILVNDEGEAIKNEHGHFKTIESIVQEATKVLPVKAGTQRKTMTQDPAEKGKGGGGNGYTGKLTMPKDVSEFGKMSREYVAQKSEGKITQAEFDEWNKAVGEALSKPAA